jgi:hypothetical protein
MSPLLAVGLAVGLPVVAVLICAWIFLAELDKIPAE